MTVKIIGTGKSVPKKVMHNKDFDKSLETNDEWIRSHTGIESRYIAEKDEKTSKFGSEACEKAIVQANNKGVNVSVSDIDVIICATATSDYVGMPSTACIIQKNIGAQKACAFDISAACSGFIYALEMAASYLERNKARYALVTGAETFSKILDWTDRSTCVLFGDGAGAVLLERTDSEADGTNAGVYSSILGADGTGAEALFVNDSGHVEMNGRTVYNFAVNKISSLITDLLTKENLAINDIDYIVCHQANERIIQAAAKRLKYDESKFVFNLQNYGNTSAATIPITLADMEERGTLKPGMKLILAGFGAGLTWGASYVVW